MPGGGGHSISTETCKTHILDVPVSEAIQKMAGNEMVPVHFVCDSKDMCLTPGLHFAEAILYRVALIEVMSRQAELEKFWNTDGGDGPKIYRMVRGLKLPVMLRVVNGRSSSVAKGQAYGLTYSGKGGPFLGPRSQKVTDLIQQPTS